MAITQEQFAGIRLGNRVRAVDAATGPAGEWAEVWERRAQDLVLKFPNDRTGYLRAFYTAADVLEIDPTTKRCDKCGGTGRLT